MVSNCANSECREPFKYFRAGKLIIASACNGHDRNLVKIEHFWLCDSCSQRLDIRITNTGSVELVQIADNSSAKDGPDSLSPKAKGLEETLRFELDFLDRGGYRRSDLWSFCEPSFFEDSPTCPNRACPGSQPIPCRDCVLAKLIPPDRLGGRRACHFIPLDDSGATLFSLEQLDLPCSEIESRLRAWLTRQLASINHSSEIAA